MSAGVPRNQLGRILVTGADGFVGTELVERLVRDGFGINRIVRRHSCVQLYRSAVINDFVVEDISDLKNYPAAFEGVFCIIHCA